MVANGLRRKARLDARRRRARRRARATVLREICRQVAALRAAGHSAVLVTSGAIARGMRLMGMPVRPTAMEELQAASAVGQGPLYDVYADLLAEHGVKTPRCCSRSSTCRRGCST